MEVTRASEAENTACASRLYSRLCPTELCRAFLECVKRPIVAISLSLLFPLSFHILVTRRVFKEITVRNEGRGAVITDHSRLYYCNTGLCVLVCTSWCIRRNPLVLGRGDKWASASLPSLSELSAPLTAQHLHLSLAVLNTFTLRPSEGESIQHQQPEMKMLDCERYTRFAVAGSRRKMVCWGGVRPRPGPRLPPLEGGGQAAMHWAA